jgi:4-amino-4-deoxychorismate lyase
MEENIVLNGELLSGGGASFPVKDEGLAYGFGLFETIKIRDGRPCFFDEHYERHLLGVDASGMNLGFSKEEVYWQARALAESMGVVNGALKIVTAKSGTRENTYLYFKRVSSVNLDRPLRIRMSSMIKTSTAFTVRHKTLNYMDNFRELSLAEEHGFDECLFTNERGELTECSAANLFFEKAGAIRTPSADCGLLEGIVRAKVIQIAREAGYSILEGRCFPEDLEEADGVFITNSGIGIAAVEEIDMGRTLSFDASNGGIIHSLSSKLDEMEKDSLRRPDDQAFKANEFD